MRSPDRKVGAFSLEGVYGYLKLVYLTFYICTLYIFGMKKTRYLIFLIFLICLFCSCRVKENANPTSEYTNEGKKISIQNINFVLIDRLVTRPDDKTKVIATLSYGDSVNVLGITNEIFK